jgi:site-specific DNA-methyltransferase (adenine-specific)
MKPYFQEGGIVIYHGDCREILPTISVEAIVSDPPYGMKRHGRYQTGANTTAGPGRGDRSSLFGETVFGDNKPFDPTHLLDYEEVMLWGFNHFPQYLSRGTMLVWLKKYDTEFGTFLSDAESAWLNRGMGIYCRRYVARHADNVGRVHPSQKPVHIMKWCLGFIKSQSVADPYMGSGTTLVAAKDLGRCAIGIEIEERYCEIAAKRLAQGVMEFA